MVLMPYSLGSALNFIRLFADWILPRPSQNRHLVICCCLSILRQKLIFPTKAFHCFVRAEMVSTYNITPVGEMKSPSAHTFAGAPNIDVVP